MYDVLINNVHHNFNSDEWYSFTGFKTYIQAKNYVRSQINSNFTFVYIRKIQKGLTTKWRSILVYSQDFYRLTVQPDSIQSFLNSVFDRNKSEVFNAAK